MFTEMGLLLEKMPNKDAEPEIYQKLPWNIWFPQKCICQIMAILLIDIDWDLTGFILCYF